MLVGVRVAAIVVVVVVVVAMVEVKVAWLRVVRRVVCVEVVGYGNTQFDGFAR